MKIRIYFILLLLITVGCTSSSLKECMNKCVVAYEEDFLINESCFNIMTKEDYKCILHDIDGIREFCNSKCRDIFRSELETSHSKD